MRLQSDVWKETLKKWRQHGPLVCFDLLRHQKSRAVIMKEGIREFLDPALKVQAFDFLAASELQAM
jgi:hypothetical protein